MKEIFVKKLLNALFDRKGIVFLKSKIDHKEQKVFALEERNLKKQSFEPSVYLKLEKQNQKLGNLSKYIVNLEGEF